MSPTKRKVFLVLECGSPHGVAHQVATISRHLNPERFETWIIYAVRPGFTPADFERMTPGAARRVYVPEMVREISPAKDLAAFWKLYRLMKREKPDVVHAQSSKAGVLARAAAFMAGVPTIYYSPHGYGFLQADAGPLRQALYWWIEKAFSGIGHIVASSEGEAALARRLSWGREVYQVRNIFTREGTPPRAPARRPGEVVVGTMARLSPSKNPMAFLRMAAALAKTHPNARFVWMGGGELEDEFRAEAARLGLSGRLETTGHVPLERVSERIAELDVFVYYSLWEGGAPIAIHEAMFCAKPVVASDIAGNVDVVIPGETGWLASSEEELARRVASLIESPELREKLGRGAKAFLEREVSLPKAMAELERLYGR